MSMSKPTLKSTKFSFNKKMIVIVIIPVILLAGLIALTSQSIRPDKMDLEVKGLNNADVFSSTYKGNIQIVEFMATWCTVCEQVTNNVGTLFKDNKIPSDVLFWSVSIDPTHDTPDVLNNYISSHNITQPVSDGRWIFGRDVYKYSAYYQATTVPHLFLVNKELKIVDDHLGLMTQDDIMNWINNLKTNT